MANTGPDQKFKHCLHSLEHAFDRIHQNIFKKGNGQWWHILLAFAYAFMRFYLLGYTSINYERNIASSAFAILLGFTQLFLKYLFTCDLRHFVQVLKTVETVHASNSLPKNKYHMICVKYANYSALIINSIPTYYACLAVFSGLAASHDYFTTGIFKAPFSMYLPHVDGEINVNADLLTIVVNVVAIIIDLAVISAYDSLVVVTFANIPMLSAIIVNKIDDFQAQLNANVLSTIEAKRKFCDIIKNLEDYKRYFCFYSRLLACMQ